MQRAAQNTPEGMRHKHRVRAENRTPQGWRSCYGVLLGGPHRRWGISGSWWHSPDQTKGEHSTFSTGAVGQTLTHCTICHEAPETRCCGVGGMGGPRRQTPKWPTVVRGYNSSPTDSKGNACLPAGHAASTSPEQGGGPGGAAPRTGSHQGSLGPEKPSCGQPQSLCYVALCPPNTCCPR